MVKTAWSRSLIHSSVYQDRTYSTELKKAGILYIRLCSRKAESFCAAVPAGSREEGSWNRLKGVDYFDRTMQRWRRENVGSKKA